MKIIRDETKTEFTSWDQVLNEAKKKSVSCLDATYDQFSKGLEAVKSASHLSFFSSPQFGYIVSLVNQIRYYDGVKEGIHYSFIHDFIQLGSLIEAFKTINGSDKLVRLGIFTNFGVFSQFLITVWLNRFLKINDIEVKNKPLNTDILASHNGFNLHFHVKDIRERERENRLSDATTILDYKLSDRAHGANKQQRLAVKSFSDVPPTGINTEYWEKLALEIEQKPQTIKVSFPADLQTKNKEDIHISIELEWRDFSGTFDGPITGFTNARLLEQFFNKLNEKIKSKVVEKKEVHILIVLTDDIYDWSDLKKQISNDQTGLLVIREFDYYIERSPFMLPTSSVSLEKELNASIPRYYDLFQRAKKK